MEKLPALLFLLALFILMAKFMSWLFIRFRLPAILGELIAGIILGPGVLNLLHWPFFSHEEIFPIVITLAELGVIFLMGIAGVEIELEEFLKTRKVALLAGTTGFLLTMATGAAVAYLFHYNFVTSLYIGLILSVTSVGISAQTLLELRRLNTREGMGLLGSAVVDDILALLTLAVFTSFIVRASADIGVVLSLVKALFYIAIAFLLARWLIPSISNWVQRQPIGESIASLAFVTFFLFSGAAEEWGGLAAITGAFIAGLGFGASPIRHLVVEKLRPLAYGFLTPIFFISIGLRADFRGFSSELVLLYLFLALGVMSAKILGCGFGAWVGGFSPSEAFKLGIGMMPQGEVALILASFGLTAGYIGTKEFVTIIMVILTTVLLTPILLRLAFEPPVSLKRIFARPKIEEKIASEG